MASDKKQFYTCLGIFVGIFSLTTIGYYIIEDMPFYDALYMTVITVSTVGYGEIHPLTPVGRMLTMISIVANMTVGGYAIGVLVRVFISGELRQSFKRRRLEKQIENLKDHFIICGFGRIGGIICQELDADDVDFVVIEQSDEAVAEIEKRGYLYLQMDATSDEALLRAGVMKARGVVTAVRDDANNVFITLTARGLRPDIFVLSRTSDVKNEGKLKRAGATKVVSPYFLGGRRMAQVLRRPTVVDFIDIATMGNKFGLIMDELVVHEKSGLVGKNLIDSHLRQDYGVIIVGIKKKEGNMIFNPLPTETLDAGDVLVLLGRKEDVKRLCAVI